MTISLYGALCLSICLLVYILVSWESPLNFAQIIVQKYRRNADSFIPPNKSILIYSAINFFSERVETDRFLGECPNYKEWCSISQERKDRSRADAIVFHNRNFNMASEREMENSTTRDPEVPYVDRVTYYSFCIIFCSVCLILYIIVAWEVPVNLSQLKSNPVDPVLPPNKSILIYAPNDFHFERVEFRFLGECPSYKIWCSISQNKTDRSKADAIVFHNRNFNMASERKLRNSTMRNLEVPYVLWGLESPTYDAFKPDPDFINWTMTYRRDADIPFPYGRMKLRPVPIAIDYEQIWDGKNQSLPPATWLVSHCNTANRRGEVVDQLEGLGLRVDKWGGCFRRTPTCKGNETEQCINNLISSYKFYVAFENSNCVDYVTEKFFDTIRSRHAVPIVMHRKKYEDLEIPSSSFIALSDYSSPSEAVQAINRIAFDKQAYLEYHNIVPDNENSTGFCALCRKLAERGIMSTDEKQATRKSYLSVQEWHANNMCNNSLVFDLPFKQPTSD